MFVQTTACQVCVSLVMSFSAVPCLGGVILEPTLTDGSFPFLINIQLGNPDSLVQLEGEQRIL